MANSYIPCLWIYKEDKHNHEDEAAMQKVCHGQL